MNDLKSVRVGCPYCGEVVPIEVDCSVEQQSYIEDCSVCCRPIEFEVMVNEQGHPKVRASREDD